MTILVALTIAVLFQFIAAFIAISLIKYTKFNFSWVLISIAFLLMAVRRLIELMQAIQSDPFAVKSVLMSWIAVAISVFILVGLIYIKRIFIFQRKLDDLRKENESRVLSAIINTAENERQIFAKELHDGLGPLISSIKMGLSALVSGKDHKKNREIIDNTQKLIEESISTIKEISNKLSPHVLNNFGLLKAVNSFIGKLGFSEDLRIAVHSNIKDLRFEHNVEVIFYRIICELITNTVSHADAGKIDIDLNYDRQVLTLDYSDDGKGFDPGKILIGDTGMGYANIQSRIKSVNGHFSLKSNVNEGVSVHITVKTMANE
jgi:signal transduction histidine kinase